LNLELINDVGQRLEIECGAIHSGPGTRWTIRRRGGADVHIILDRGREPDRFTGWIFDPRAILGQTATHVVVPAEMTMEQFVAAVARTRTAH
jgi:hypothetical protein